MKPIAMLLLSAALVLADPVLIITRTGVFAQGDQDVVYNIDVCLDGSLTSWIFATNFIGNSTNSPPEFIDFIDPAVTNKAYRVNPE